MESCRKPRHNTDKAQNKYGGDYNCPQFDILSDGKEFCHDEGQDEFWREPILWSQVENGKLVCRGNRHSCNKLRLKWIASMSEEKKQKYFNK